MEGEEQSYNFIHRACVLSFSHFNLGWTNSPNIFVTPSYSNVYKVTLKFWALIKLVFRICVRRTANNVHEQFYAWEESRDLIIKMGVGSGSLGEELKPYSSQKYDGVEVCFSFLPQPQFKIETLYLFPLWKISQLGSNFPGHLANMFLQIASKDPRVFKSFQGGIPSSQTPTPGRWSERMFSPSPGRKQLQACIITEK